MLMKMIHYKWIIMKLQNVEGVVQFFHKCITEILIITYFCHLE